MITLEVNGQQQQLDVDPATPLLWVVRDHLSITGPKFGCGMGLCGACTVQLDGTPVRSCVTPVSGAVGKKVTTIEGIAGGPRIAGCVGRGGRATVRILPVGPDHERERAAGRQPRSQ
jgi:aerobic-type carbon monoxide dehydrogenase small subunit (CoxS/CutS family)